MNILDRANNAAKAIERFNHKRKSKARRFCGCTGSTLGKWCIIDSDHMRFHYLSGAQLSANAGYRRRRAGLCLQLEQGPIDIPFTDAPT